MFQSFWRSAWLLLSAANLFWAGNIVLARGIAGQVPPIMLAYLRWTGAFLIAVGFAWPRLKADLPVLVRHWRVMLVLSATGIASYNAMSYIGLNSTTALNGLLLQSASPLIILIWAFALYREVPTPRQTAGILLSLAGVAVIAGRGSMATLLRLELNAGDLWILGGLILYSCYCVVLRRRPAVHPLSFLVAAMAVGSCMMLPFTVWEGGGVRGGPSSYLAIAYMAVVPSLAAYLCFNRGVELIGAAAAGQSMHLMPLFGSILTALFLHERVRLYHVAGIAIIAGGILLASARWRRRPDTAVRPEAT